MTRTLVLWCPDWPITAAGYDTDDFVAVVEANRVVATSQAARRSGVRRGLRRREAQARCPELVVLEADPGRDARAFEPVVALVETFTTGVEVLRPGACAFATRGPSRYFGGDESLAAHVVARAREVTPLAQAGVADGVFAAGLAARESRIVPPGESASFLAPFSVSVLPDPDLNDLLVRLGIRTLGDLAALPAGSIAARFGPAGERAHRLASAADDRVLAGRVPPPDLVASVELDPPAERVDTATFAAKAMADDIAGRLHALGLACTRVRIEAETEHGESLVRVWRHDGPLSAARIAERVRWQLDGWLNGTTTGEGGQPTAGVTLLRIVPEEVVADDGRQLGFWGGDAAAAERAARAFARVQGLLGPDAVCTAVLTGGRGPADRVRLVPWGDPRDDDGSAKHPWPGHVPEPAPATVHAAPLPAEVVDASGAPVHVSGRLSLTAAPARVSIGGGAWAVVEAWAGPWPVDERWWDTSAHRRRARFQVATPHGAHLLAVERGMWLVEATYD